MKICLLHCNKLFISLDTFFMYLSFAPKIAFSNFFSLRNKFLSVCGPRILIICLVALNTELVFLEALKKWFCAFKLQNDFFCKKAQTHENLSSALQKTVYFIRKKHFSCTWAWLLKLHLATFSHWEISFWASVASHSHNLISCTKHRIGVLRSYKEVILCI